MSRITSIAQLVVFIACLIDSKTSALHELSNCASSNLRVACGMEGGNPYCKHVMSGQCNRNGDDVPKHCHDTLGNSLDVDVCRLQQHDGDSRCGRIRPGHITPPKAPLAKLYLYYHESAWKGAALVNLTLPDPAWKELRIQYAYVGSKNYNSRCRNFTLYKPVNASLMYDCFFETRFGNDSRNIELTVQTDSGQGASYLFRIPPGYRINPEEVCPSKWHTFFYIHLGALLRYERLPVTIQSSPYGLVEYKVVLARCQEVEEEECIDPEEVEHMYVTKDTSDDLWLVEFEPIITGGNFIITIQMIADWCPKDKGCYASFSPIFKVPSSSRWIMLLMTILLILMFLCFVVIMIWQRKKVNSEFIRTVRNKGPSVLLVYHPESQAALGFVNTLAEFLKKTCYVTGLMADREVGNENPTSWTKEHMNTSKRVLFIVPEDPEAQSFTSIRNQWKVALNHCTGHDFISNQGYAKRLGKLLHPTSGDVPCEIRDIHRFELSHGPAALANWLHGGSFLDQLFFWLPHIRSFTKNNITPTWADVLSAAKQINLPPTAPNEEPFTASPVGRVEVEMDISDGECSTGGGGDSDASDGEDFDPDIPEVNDKLCEPCQGSITSLEDCEDGSIFD